MATKWATTSTASVGPAGDPVEVVAGARDLPGALALHCNPPGQSMSARVPWPRVAAPTARRRRRPWPTTRRVQPAIRGRRRVHRMRCESQHRSGKRGSCRRMGFAPRGADRFAVLDDHLRAGVLNVPRTRNASRCRTERRTSTRQQRALRRACQLAEVAVDSVRRDLRHHQTQVSRRCTDGCTGAAPQLERN